MLPIIDKPIIQFVVEEAIISGIEDIIIITGRGKRAIEDYFDTSPELESHLLQNKKYELLREVKDISSLDDIHYIRQKEPKGLGDAVLKAEKHIGDEPFAVLLGDDIIKGDIPCIDLDKSIYRIEDIIEKPSLEEAPSNIGTVGRYILTPEIFSCIKETPLGKGNEIQLTDDAGDKQGYVKAIIDFALEREDLRGEIGRYLQDIVVALPLPQSFKVT
jgi:UTP--glucose-1-phosphate uridylyltransferase